MDSSRVGARKSQLQRITRPTPDEIAAASGRLVPDLIRPDLKALFCGINPSVYTAAVGHHFARPGNRFWRALFDAGITDRLLAPHEEHILLSLGYGITSLVQRPTVAAAELSKQELREGAVRLEELVIECRPAWIAFVGIGAYRIAYGRPGAAFGLQDCEISGSKVWVLPNPSGLNAHFTPKDFADRFRELRLAIEDQERPSG